MADSIIQRRVLPRLHLHVCPVWGIGWKYSFELIWHGRPGQRLQTTSSVLTAAYHNIPPA